MRYYTYSNHIKELTTSLTNLEVKDLGALESLSGATVLIFYNLFSLRLPDTTVRSDFLIVRRPDWWVQFWS